MHIVIDGEEKTFKLGHGEYDPLIEKCIITMKAEEKVRLFIPQAAWDKGDDAMIEIELLDFLNVYDLKDDGNLMKKIIRQGFGYERCGFKDEIKIDLSIYQGETTIFEAKDYPMILNQDDNVLFEILKSMKIKE